MKITSKILWLLLVLGCLLPTSSRAAKNYPWVPSQIEPGELATVYGTMADEISIEEAGLMLLKLTNAARTEAGRGELKLGGTAGLLATEHAVEMAASRFLNHHSLSGLKCEARFNLLGQTDFVTENIAYYEIQHAVYLTPQLVRRIHQHWLQSENHLANLLQPAYTQMGSSFQVITGEETTYVAAAVNFVADFGDYDRLPVSTVRGDRLELGGYITPGAAEFAFIGIGTEELPKQRTVEYQLAHMEPYSQPEFDIVIMPAGSAPKYRFGSQPYVKYTADHNPSDGNFSAEIRLPRHWPTSAVYLTVWAENPEIQDSPFCVMTQVVLTQ